MLDRMEHSYIKIRGEIRVISMPLLYHAYVYLEFLILACTIYILAPFSSLIMYSSICHNTDNTHRSIGSFGH